MTLIEVCDNGTGITDEDARAMAMANHTSKISCFQDLGKKKWKVITKYYVAHTYRQ